MTPPLCTTNWRGLLSLYYGKPEAYAKLMRSAIALNGSFFNTQRMVSQYVTNAYFPAKENWAQQMFLRKCR